MLGRGGSSSTPAFTSDHLSWMRQGTATERPSSTPDPFDASWNACSMFQAVPDWKERMFEAAGTYSKGLGKPSHKGFTNDVEVI